LVWSVYKLAKSSILFSKNTETSTTRSIQEIIPFKISSSASYYLGLPLFIGKSKKEAFQPIITKILGKLDGWRAKTLSQAGRTVLIKSVASMIPSYPMSTFLLPISFCEDLDKIFKNFWWGFPKDKTRNLCLKSWSSICTPKAQGGLGLKTMAAVNLALIAKLGWKILSDPDSFCFKQLRAKYIQYGDLFTSPYPGNASWLWKGILRTKSLLQSGTCLKVSSSSNFPIWTTSWIPTIQNFRPSPKFPNNLSLPSFLISDLLNPDTLTWNSFSVNAIFDHDLC
jgi:hypothetical protein